MATGAFDFYELQQQDRVWYFYGAPGDTLTELLYRVKLSENEIQEDKRFQSQLESLGLQRGLPENSIRKLNNIHYNYSDIRKAALLINNTDMAKENQPGAERRRVHFFATAGLIQYHFPSDFQGLKLPFFSLYQFSDELVFTGGFNLEYSLLRNSDQLKIGLGIGMSHIDVSTGKVDSLVTDPGVTIYKVENYTLNMTTLLFTPYICYQPMLSSSVLPFIKMGFVFSVPTKKENIDGSNSVYTVDLNNNTVTPNDGRAAKVASINSTWVNPMLAIGASYKRFSVEGNYWFNSPYGQAAGTSMNLSAMGIQVQYRITK
jgi:hypothetical protein